MTQKRKTMWKSTQNPHLWPWNTRCQ